MANPCCSSMTAMRSNIPARLVANRSERLSTFESSTRNRHPPWPASARRHSNRYSGLWLLRFALGEGAAAVPLGVVDTDPAALDAVAFGAGELVPVDLAEVVLRGV